MLASWNWALILLLAPFLGARAWGAVPAGLDAAVVLKTALALAGLLLLTLLGALGAMHSPGDAARVRWSIETSHALGGLAALLSLGLGLISLRVGQARPWSSWLAGLPLLLLAATAPPRSELVEQTRQVAPRWRDGVCRQTTWFTCTAAAAATLLHAVSVTAGESEMAAWCATDQAGTRIGDLTRGLNARLGAGLTARAVRLAPEQVRAQRRPCIAFTSCHAFVVYGPVGDDTLEIGDPLQGRLRVAWSAFSSRFTGVAVVLTPTEDDDPGAPDEDELEDAPLRFGSGAAEPW